LLFNFDEDEIKVGVDMSDLAELLTTIRQLAAADHFRLSQHAQTEMAEEAILLSDVLHAIADGHIIENYPEHRRGACCLLNGTDATGRDIHAVCTTSSTPLMIITVYLPLPPKWMTPTQRRRSI
jgi:hypothetical protein